VGRTLFVLALIAAGCSRAAPRRPNVLIVTIDTLRPDAIGEGTPAIRGFLAEATRFRATRTVAPLTLPSHTSMFTGLFPKSDGIHDNVTEPIPPRGNRPFPFLAEQFKDKGYATAAFVSRAVLAPATGVGAGFDLYDCPGSDLDWMDEGGYIPGDERVRAAAAWIEGASRKGSPWFAWVHLFDPHAPYHAFEGDARRAPTRDSDPVAVRYAGEVRRTDAAFEKLLQEVPRDTIIFLVSDHGEGLFEHGEPTHGPFCYSTTLDVLLAVRAPGFRPGAEDKGLRSVADVAPTIRRLCGLPAVEGEGRDLGGPPHETLVSESLMAWGLHGWGQCFAATDGRYTLVEAGESLDLFDRAKDPKETVPLPLSDPAYERLDRALEAFRASKWGGPGGGEGEMLASVAPYGELRRPETGYLSRHQNAQLPNPRRYLKTWSALQDVRRLFQICTARHDPMPLEGALKTLDDLARDCDSPQIDHYRACLEGAIADLKGEKARYRDAALAELAAIGKGYEQRDAIAPAIHYCVAASDPDALRALVQLLRRSGKRLDAETQHALDAAEQELESAGTAYSVR
jgi:hypothetical protein